MTLQFLYHRDQILQLPVKKENKYKTKQTQNFKVSVIFSFKIPLMSRNACNGEKSPDGWQFELDATNRHFKKGPFAISIEFLFSVWRFWRLTAISAIFSNACISGHTSKIPREMGATKNDHLPPANSREERREILTL